ncbi:hypothetical protein HanPSC8_Chr05g0216811 [Helianthus annuus]|nr:hypothetical protein HanPSC8_Chr05g0216811 [Helianthus annuus]
MSIRAYIHHPFNYSHIHNTLDIIHNYIDTIIIYLTTQLRRPIIYRLDTPAAVYTKTYIY